MAFSYRDIRKEVGFIKAAYNKHTNGAPLRWVYLFAVGCQATGLFVLITCTLIFADSSAHLPLIRSVVELGCGPALHTIGKP